MSGHSKWHSIKHKKGIVDAKKGAKFTQLARLITVAAQKGGSDTDLNPSLRLAIEKAKEINMPNINIERAIKKGTGELKEGVPMEEVIYEGYGPSGIALFIQAVTDNKNRTVSQIKTALSKYGGSMGTLGCTAWMFRQQGVIHADASAHSIEDIELCAIDLGASDVQPDGNSVEIHTAPQDFIVIKEALQKAGYNILSSEITFVPKDVVTVSDPDVARKILKLMEALEELEDVSSVASNFDISEEVMSLAEH